MMRVIAIAGLLTATSGAALAQQSQVILLGDSGMSCSQIIVAASETTEILGGAPEGGVFASEEAINTATSLAMQGAIHSGIGRAIPGIGAVGGLLGRAARARREEEEARQQIAERRWYYLNGLYEGRMCDDVLRQEAATAPVVEAQPVETMAVSADAVSDTQ